MKGLSEFVADYNRVYVSIKDVPKVSLDAIVAIEDHGFYEHGPVDFSSIMRAFIATPRRRAWRVPRPAIGSPRRRLRTRPRRRSTPPADQPSPSRVAIPDMPEST